MIDEKQLKEDLDTLEDTLNMLESSMFEVKDAQTIVNERLSIYEKMTKEHLILDIKSDLDTINKGLEVEITIPEYRYIDFVTFRLCPRTERLQHRFDGEYNYRVLDTETKDFLIIIVKNTYLRALNSLK